PPTRARSRSPAAPGWGSRPPPVAGRPAAARPSWRAAPRRPEPRGPAPGRARRSTPRPPRRRSSAPDGSRSRSLARQGGEGRVGRRGGPTPADEPPVQAMEPLVEVDAPPPARRLAEGRGVGAEVALVAEPPVVEGDLGTATAQGLDPVHQLEQRDGAP